MKTRLAVLLFLFVVLSLAYSLVTPLFEAPDEVWHYAYLRYLAEEHALPSLADDASGAYQEVAQPPLYYAVAALVSGLAPDDDLDELMWHNPGFGYQAGGTVNDNKNMLIHTARERFPWRGAVLAIHLARLVSLLFGTLTVLAAWGLGRETFPHRPALSLSVAAVVAFIPQFLFISGVASNDSAAAALSTAALWAIARAVNRGITARRSLAVGLLVGLAALTKTSTLLLVPLALVSLALAARHPPFAIRHSLFSIIPVSIVGGWWYLRNALLYGDPLGLHVHADTPWGRAVPASAATILKELPRLYRSFWGAFGWGHVWMPVWVYWGLGAGLLISLIGWGRALATRRLPGRSRVLLLALSWWLLIFAALLQWMRQVQAPHGRLLFPAIGAFAVLIVGGWASLPSSPRPLVSLSPCLLVSLSPLHRGLKVPHVAVHPCHLGVGQHVDVGMIEYLLDSALQNIGGGLKVEVRSAELGHLAAQVSLPFHQHHRVSGGGDIERGLHPGHPAADDQHSLCQRQAKRLQFTVPDDSLHQRLDYLERLFGRQFRLLLVHPGALLADVGDLAAVGVQPDRGGCAPERLFVHGGGAGRDDHAVQIVFLDAISEQLLPRLGAHVAVVFGVDDIGVLADLFGYPFHVYRAGDVDSAVTDEYSDTAHFFPSGFVALTIPDAVIRRSLAVISPTNRRYSADKR